MVRKCAARHLGATGTLVFALCGFAVSQDKAPLELSQTIPLEGVQGKIDHLAVDVATKRLLVAATGSNAVVVVDLGQGKVVHRIEGQSEPQGVLFIPELKRLVVANGEDGSCRIYDSESYKLIKSLDFKKDGDNVRYDSAAKRLYVAHEAGGLGIIDAEKLEKVGEVKLDAHPEAFQLEKGGHRIFVNVPDAKQVVVVDREKGTVLAKWPMGKLADNFPMALDETNHRVFIGCRKPSKVVVFDSETGKSVAEIPCSRDTDDLFYDAPTKRIYLSSGEGFIDTIEQKDADHYKRIYYQSSAAQARTSIWVAELGSFYVAVPQREGQKAEVRVYKPKM
jgi:DNA-binding beta-propeller fold protein YncE